MTSSIQLSRQDDSIWTQKMRPNRMSSSQLGYRYGVFLGGACNPTTWRKKTAIPSLEQENIPYFNPQVEEWSPELIDLERRAKNQSYILLFVFEPNLTRGLASFIEVAYLASLGRRLVIVRPNFTKLYTILMDKNYGIDSECIIEAFKWLDNIQMPNVKTFTSVEEAVDYVKSQYLNCLKGRARIHSLKAKQTKGPRRSEKAPVRRKTHRGNFSVCSEANSRRTSEGGRHHHLDSPPDLHHVETDTLPVLHRATPPPLYFCITSDNFCLVDQMEAAFAMGRGEKVALHIDFLSDTISTTARSRNSSGYSSLASTPEETNFALPVSSDACPFRLQSHLFESSSRVPLSPTVIKDHNRSRAYLKSVAEETDNSIACCAAIDIP